MFFLRLLILASELHEWSWNSDRLTIEATGFCFMNHRAITPPITISKLRGYVLLHSRRRVAKRTTNVDIYSTTYGHTLERSRMLARGRDATGGLHDPTSSVATIASTLGTSHTSVPSRTARKPSLDPITSRSTCDTIRTRWEHLRGARSYLMPRWVVSQVCGMIAWLRNQVNRSVCRRHNRAWCSLPLGTQLLRRQSRKMSMWIVKNHDWAIPMFSRVLFDNRIWGFHKLRCLTWTFPTEYITQLHFSNIYVCVSVYFSKYISMPCAATRTAFSQNFFETISVCFVSPGVQVFQLL